MIDPVAIGLTGQTEQKEQTEFREKKSEGERTNSDLSRLNMTSAAARIT